MLISYTAGKRTIETVQIESPTLDEYDRLHAEHSADALNCPCTKISSEYGQIMALDTGLS